MTEGKFLSLTTREGLPSDDVQSIYEDRESNIWIGTTAGLTRFKENVFSTVTTKDGLVSNDVKTLFEDTDGALWIGTSDGLSRFKDGKFFIRGGPGFCHVPDDWDEERWKAGLPQRSEEGTALAISQSSNGNPEAGDPPSNSQGSNGNSEISEAIGARIRSL